ncbi:MAG: YcaO-like family protein [Pseudaminobacter sp.]
MPSRPDGPFPYIGDPPQVWREAFLASAAESLSLRPEASYERIVQRLLPFCRRFGITRLADITGLDRLGLPVVQAVRPAALSEVTALGRGGTLTRAAVGAIMEACERYFAEAVPASRTFTATADEMGIEPGLFDGLVRPDGADDWRRRRLPWITGMELPSGAAAPIPFELVHTRYSHPAPVGDGVFTRSTTGLACHRSVGEAFLHGLYECIERDALARAFRTHGFFDRYRLSPPKTGATAKLLQAAGEAGISVAFWQAPSSTGLPVVWCQTLETGPERPILALPTEGYSARGSMEAACEDALREALVTRAATVSGARDDQTAPHYAEGRFSDALAKARDLILHHDPQADRPPGSTALPVNLADLLALVTASGLGPVFAVPVGLDHEAGVVSIRTVLGRAQAFSVVR